MKTKIRYYVIFTIQVVNGKATNRFKPDIVKRPLFHPSDVEYNEMSVSRKYVGILSFDQLIQFLNEVDFESTCDTMGSLTEYGHLDAVSFEKTEDDYFFGSQAYINAYISVLYDDELQLSEKLTEEKIEMIWNHTDKIMKWLKKDAIDDAWDIEHKTQDISCVMDFDEVYFDFNQLTIPF